MWSKGFFISSTSITFHSWKVLSYNLLFQEHWRLFFFFFYILTFFRPTCLKSEHKVKGHKKVFWILSNSLSISVGTFDINERKTIFEITKILKTIILSSSVRRRILQTFKTFGILIILSRIYLHFAFPCCTKSRFQ